MVPHIMKYQKIGHFQFATDVRIYLIESSKSPNPWYKDILYVAPSGRLEEVELFYEISFKWIHANF